jgi:hypothetical protein
MRASRVSFARTILATAALAVALFVAPASALATKTLGLSAGIFKYDIAAGAVKSGSVIVMNSGTEPLKVMVYASDQAIDDKGGITYTAPTRADLSNLASPATWTRLTMPANSKSLGNIPYLELKPGERVPVKFTIEVPSNVTPGDHNVLIFFESFELPTKGATSQTQISGRLGARVTLRVKGALVEKLEVRPFNVPSFVIGSEVPYQFVVRNVGNVDQRIGGRVMLLDRGDNTIAQQTAINGVTVFGNTNREATGTLVANKLPVGPFKVRIDVTKVDDTGHAVNAGADTITEVHDVWLVPMWLLVLLGIIVVLVVVRIIWSIAASATRTSDARKLDKAAAAPVVAAPVAAEPDGTYYDPDKAE